MKIFNIKNIVLALGLVVVAAGLSSCVAPGPGPGGWVPGHYGPYGGWIPGHYRRW